MEVLRLAGWDEAVIPEAVRVVNCESGGVVDVLGDGGLAQGIFQIHIYGWTQGYHEAFTDFEGEAFNPVDNALLALLIYNRNVSRGADRWHNWTCRPMQR